MSRGDDGGGDPIALAELPGALSGLRADHPLAAHLERPPPCLRLADLPTPVERAAWLDAGAAEVWIKRDDRTSTLYGGGKVRKFEWLLASPRFAGGRPIVSVGGIGSHHLVSLALFLRGLDRRLHAMTFEQVVTPHVRQNLGVLVSQGVRLWHVRSRSRLPLAWLGYHVWDRPETMGVSMSPGGSTGVGGLGFVQAGLELAAQIDAGLLPRPATIYVTGGSAGSSAGLALGLALAGVSTHLRVVSAVERWGFNGILYKRMLRQIAGALRDGGLAPGRLEGGAAGLLRRAGVTWSIDHGFVDRGYAVPSAAGREAAAIAGDHGLALETTYTGKCLAALRADLAAGRREGPILFWNTHGANDLQRWITHGWERRLPTHLADRLRALSP